MFTTRKPLSTGLVILFTAFGTCQAGSLYKLTQLGTVTAGGYTFINFDGPNSGTNAAAGTNMNGISNTGAAVGFDIDNNGAFHNFVARINPLKFPGAQAVNCCEQLEHWLKTPDLLGTATVLNINGNPQAMAFGINRRGEVVGTDGAGKAFAWNQGVLRSFLPLGGIAATAFGINDVGNIVGQYTTAGGAQPGFFVPCASERRATVINAPSGPNVVNAQGINNKGEIVGFYSGTDGQVHGFLTRVLDARNGTVTGTPLADPVIPNVAGEPGAVFVFSQVLGVNDAGIAVGYYGDSTTSQHGFLYNLTTGQYTFLDDPAEAFNNGVEVTQITGINNRDEITGFYSDANGVFHAFVACPNGFACSAIDPSNERGE